MKRLLLRFFLGCPHKRETFPQRATDGLDYVCCLHCGRRRRYGIGKDEVKFTGRTPSRESEPPTGIQRWLKQRSAHPRQTH